VLDPTPVYFDVVPDDAADENGVKVIEVLRPNMPQKGIIKISKTGEVFATVTEQDGVYQPVYEMQGLAGAVYDIIAAEDIYSGGVLRYAKGEVVDTVTTLADKPVESIELYLGKYTIMETKASYGTVLNTEPKDVELTYAGQEVEITEIAADMDNRISLYVAQYGKCAITGQILELHEIHCHHKKPVSQGGNDRYENLIILHKDIHRLLHATKEETIKAYLSQLQLTYKQKAKLNKLRQMANMQAI